MTELLTAAQMRAIEAAAIASGEVTGLELMERAGRGVVQAVFAEWPELALGSFRAVVLCGPGGNGGDGFVVARLLKEWGWEVEVFLYGTPERMPPDARVNYERWVGMGEVQPLEPGTIHQYWAENVTCYRLWVDALFGTGLTRPAADDALGQVLRVMSEIVWAPSLHPNERVVAVDVPSGLCADSGRFLQEPKGILHEDVYALAHLTVTFHRKKVGLSLADASLYCGTVVIADIGLKTTRSIGDEAVRELTLSTAIASMIGKSSGHKYTHGHALILSGPSGHGGAARLAARGALRIGAGLVTVGCPPDVVSENAAQLNAIMLRPVGDAAALSEVLQDTRINALCLGPGLGVERAAELIPVTLASRGLHPPYVVLDADALTALSRDPLLFAQLHKNCVLTPHAGEFARLFPYIAAKLAAPATTGPAYSKVDATREAAKRAGCVVLFKGPDTVIADPSGRCAINSAHYDRAAPWLATAGSGDVLAGFITGLLARGFQPMQAAETAAWLHVECARSFGPGLIAEDLPEELPKVFRTLGL